MTSFRVAALSLWSSSVLAVDAAAGYSDAIAGDIDPWGSLSESNGAPTEAQHVDNVLAQVQLRSIGSLGRGGHHTFETLSAIVNGLSARAYILTIVSDLLGY